MLENPDKVVNNKENKEGIKYSLEFKIDPERDMEVIQVFVNNGRD